MNAEEYERLSLELASDTQAELRDVLNSLGSKQGNGLVEHYLFYSSAHINRAVEGYICLRKTGRFESSKLLIRTAIEALIRIQAVREKPEILFQILFNETMEDKKWVRSIRGPDAEEVLQKIDANWAELAQRYRAMHPEHHTIEQEVQLINLAHTSGIQSYYNSHYRLYCRFTHAAARAILGDLTEFEKEDNRTMTLCALAAVEALVSLGATASRLKYLKERISEDNQR